MKMDVTVLLLFCTPKIIIKNTCTLARYKKKSFGWYKEVIATNGASLEK